MYPATIEQYAAPATLNEALAALSSKPDAICIAGGQSLMQALKARLMRTSFLIDLQHVGELTGVRVSAQGVAIGAMTRYAKIAADTRFKGAYEALIDAASHVGDRQVRNRGTLGGSLCWNHPAACCPPACLALGAQLELASLEASGCAVTRTIAAEEFVKGPLETARRPDEILVSIKLPAPPPNAGSAYKKWGLVTDALPVIGIAVFVATDAAGACTSARVALGGLASGPRRFPAAERILAGAEALDAKRIDQAFAAAAEAAQVDSDLWATKDYRKHLIRELGREVAASAFARARGGR